MHDPQTVALEIGFTWGKTKHRHKRCIQIATIWHCDPESGTLGCREDDSCGWFAPGYTDREAEAIRKLAKSQYDQLFARQVAIAEAKSYAHICYDQSIHGAIYWSWRAIKAYGKKGWQYGRDLSHKETEYIFRFAYDPADNFQHHKIKDYRSFEEFFFLIWRCYRRFSRPWYKHPRWHVRHWKVQFHPFQNLKRRLWDKCCICGKRGFKGSAHRDWDGTRIWHAECDQSHHKSPL